MKTVAVLLRRRYKPRILAERDEPAESLSTMKTLTKLGKTGWIAIVALVVNVPAWAIPLSGPIVNPTNGNSYLLLSQNNWVNSEAEAISLGGHLVTINDAAENQWVWDTFSRFDGTNRFMWIGLNNVASQGASEMPVTPGGYGSWPSGDPSTFAWASGDTSTYRNWNSPEPNNWYLEHYVYIYGDWGGASTFWNDYQNKTTEYNGAVPIFGVVEITPLPPVPDGGVTACLIGSAMAILAVQRRRLTRA